MHAHAQNNKIENNKAMIAMKGGEDWWGATTLVSNRYLKFTLFRELANKIFICNSLSLIANTIA